MGSTSLGALGEQSVARCGMRETTFPVLLAEMLTVVLFSILVVNVVFSDPSVGAFAPIHCVACQ